MTSRQRHERGASVVEAAILTAILSLSLISAMQQLEDRTGSTIDQNGTRIGTPVEQTQDPTTTTTTAP